ncbi:Mycobacterium numidiamassiliense ORFan [Mycobacterium numidiamassiliense]|uniref:Mycobacterium numidiamassiliense ORFan n=1 Tax=Mycobacterium numidiamassiliense TaxID=1841861 RepID=A0A2U3P9W6_9MYCO|nr:Mycobacterium numidiamassiliense ORFan [Mycobacterium numidiamassiliense]
MSKAGTVMLGVGRAQSGDVVYAAQHYLCPDA